MNTFLNISKGVYPKFDLSTTNTTNTLTSASESKSSSFVTRKNEMDAWDWELACLFVDILADICIHSPHITIKRKALCGFHQEPTEAFKSRIIKPNVHGYGIIDTARFQLIVKENQEGIFYFGLFKSHCQGQTS